MTLAKKKTLSFAKGHEKSVTCFLSKVKGITDPETYSVIINKHVGRDCNPV